MSVLLALFQQAPMLLMAVPLCGLLSLCLARWWGDALIRRSFLVNGGLSLVCVLMMMLNFANEPKRTGLSPAESFQQVNLLLTDVEDKVGYRFGIDGCTFWLVVLTAAFPLLVGWETQNSRKLPPLSGQRISPPLGWKSATGLLGTQLSMLIFLLALDRRVQMVALPVMAVAVHFLLAVTVTASKRRSLGRRMRRILLSDFLIIAGYLCATTPLLRYTKLGNHPTELFDLIRILSEIEEIRLEDFTSYQRLMGAIAPSMYVMLVGCVLRFGTFPFTEESREMWKETSPLVRTVLCLYGPVVGTATIWRELQLFPDIGFRLMTVVSYIGAAGLFILAIRCRMKPDANDDSLSMVYVSTLLVMVAGGSNTTSLMGALLILTGLLGCALWPQSRDFEQLSPDWLIRWAARFSLTFGAAIGLLGLWQSTGPGSRGLGLALLTGISFVLLASRKNTKQPRKSRARCLLTVDSLHPASMRGERPIWDVSAASETRTARPGLLQTAFAIAALLLIIVMPQWIWHQVRWDFQKLEFPESAGGFASREVQP